nr:hypothetical protein [Tanacetum cinerariifolium]
NLGIPMVFFYFLDVIREATTLRLDGTLSVLELLIGCGLLVLAVLFTLVEEKPFELELAEVHYASNCIVKPRKWDDAYLQQQLQITLEEEAGIQSTQEEFKFMAAVDAYEETERVKSKSSCLSNNIEKVEENHRNSQVPKNQKHMSSKCNNITLDIQNAKSKIVCVMCKQCLVTANHDVCVLNYVNDMNSLAYNQSANVLIRENQKIHKANAKKSNELGSKGSLASSRPSEPRTCLRWIPTGSIFAMCGKLNACSNTESKSKKSVCENASTSNPLKPSSKGFSSFASLLGRLSRLRKQHTSIYPIDVL